SARLGDGRQAARVRALRALRGARLFRPRGPDGSDHRCLDAASAFPAGHRVIYAATIFLSSFLLFLVQPLIARLILPWFGGSAAVWTTCMLFFQVLLLGGYAYAHVLNAKLRGRGQAILHSLLLAAAVACLPIAPAESWKPAGGDEPVSRILLLLGATVEIGRASCRERG